MKYRQRGLAERPGDHGGAVGDCLGTRQPGRRCCHCRRAASETVDGHGAGGKKDAIQKCSDFPEQTYVDSNPRSDSPKLDRRGLRSASYRAEKKPHKKIAKSGKWQEFGKVPF